MVYRQIWINRCYDDLPDEIPMLLAKSNRAPSYKSIAMCILNNDLLLKGIGFVDDETETIKKLKFNLKQSKSKQMTFLS